MSERTTQWEKPVRACPECGEKGTLYRTPRGLRWADCVRKMDFGGLGFRR